MILKKDTGNIALIAAMLPREKGQLLNEFGKKYQLRMKMNAGFLLEDTETLAVMV